jgi:hypothetical protein
MSKRILLLTALATVLAACSASARTNSNEAVIIQNGKVTQSLSSSYAAPPPLNVPAPAPLAAAPVEARLPAPRVDCDIDVRRTSNGIALEGLAHFTRSTDGDYSFVITKSGRGGSSDIEQGGEYDARAGQELALGSAEFSTERGSSWRATLKIYDGGREICRTQARS